MMRSHDISTPPIPGGMRNVFVLRPNRCGSTWSLPPRSRASSLADSNARLTGAQTEDGLVAELRHRAGLFDRMWRAQVGRLADGSTMDRAPESLANRLSFGGAGTRCAVSGGRYARANCTNVQIIAAKWRRRSRPRLIATPARLGN